MLPTIRVALQHGRHALRAYCAPCYSGNLNHRVLLSTESTQQDVELSTASVPHQQPEESLGELLEVPAREQMRRSSILQWLNNVAHLARKSGAEVAEVTSHRNYRLCAPLLERIGRVESVSAARLLSPSSSLVDMGVPVSDPVLALLINDLTWNVRTMSVQQLLAGLTLSLRFPDAATAQKLTAACVQSLQRRWVELDSIEDVIGVISHCQLFSTELLQRVEDLSIELAARISARQMSKLLHQLATSGRRLTPVLRALTYHEARREEPCNFRDAVTVLFALNRLRFYDDFLLDKLGRDMTDQMATVGKPSLVAAALNGCGQLRWRCVSLLDAAVFWYSQHLDECSAYETSALLQALAVLNYQPVSLDDQLLERMLQTCTADSLPTARAWLDVVWSLTVLGKATSHQLASVLEEGFVARLEKEMAGSSAGGSRLKLLNLSAVASTRQDYRGPVLPEGTTRSAVAPLRTKEAETLQRGVMEALVHFLPPPKYLSVAVPPDSGLRVDAEFVLRSNGAPSVIQPYGSAMPGAVDSTSSQTLPSDLCRVTLCTWTFKDFTVGSVVLTGYNQVTLDLLQSLGYKVLQVSHAEFKQSAPVVDQVKLLRNKALELVTT